MSWYQLQGISQERQYWLDYWKSRGPIACPNDGEPLKLDPQGRLHCPFDGYVDNGVASP